MRSPRELDCACRRRERSMAVTKLESSEAKTAPPFDFSDVPHFSPWDGGHIRDVASALPLNLGVSVGAGAKNVESNSAVLHSHPPSKLALNCGSQPWFARKPKAGVPVMLGNVPVRIFDHHHSVAECFLPPGTAPLHWCRRACRSVPL